MRSKLWITLAAMLLALSAAACSDDDKDPISSKTCDPACGSGLVCNEITGECVGCLDRLDCSLPTPLCRTADHVCVECLEDANCVVGYVCNLGFCEQSGSTDPECDEENPCTGDADCVEGICVERSECTADTEATDCPKDGECTETGICLTSKQVNCKDAAPEHASNTSAQVTITWTAENGWTEAANCAWDCDNGFVLSSDRTSCDPASACTTETVADDCPKGGECVDNACLTSKQVDCKASGLDHATDTAAQVTITWSPAGGWTTPATCAWDCETGYEKNGTQTACVCTPGCNGNVYCSDSHQETACNQDVCISGQGCSECATSADCDSDEYYCSPTNSCEDVTCSASTGCIATYETCDTSANAGAGECVPAPCSGSACSGDYACIGNEYTLCDNGCSDNQCNSASTGCAAESDPDGYCWNQPGAVAVCELSTGICRECIVDANPDHNTCSSSEECVNNSCRSLCGNGILNVGEDCDPQALQSTWQYKTCDEYAQAAGETNPWSGIISCNNDCTMNIDQCEEVVTPPVAPIDWCNLQHPASVTLASASDSENVYGRIPTADVSKLTGVKLVYGSNVASISSWADLAAIVNTTVGGNTEYQATIDSSVYNVLDAGTYYYTYAISGDGTNWFYCPHAGHQEDGNNDDGGAPTQTPTVSQVGTLTVTKGGALSWTVEDFENFNWSTTYTSNTFTSQGITWNSPSANIQTAANYILNGAKSITIRSSASVTSYLEATNITGGIGILKFKYRVADALEFTVASGSYSYSSGALTNNTSITNTFEETINSLATSFKIEVIAPTTGNRRLVIDDVEWTPYSGN